MGTPRLFNRDSGAAFSACERYRYRLWRTWDASKQSVAFIMLNPSTADATLDDPTIRRCIGFARKWGAGGLIVGNLFAWRATDPRELRITDDPVGPDNDDSLRGIARQADKIVCAWGAHGKFRRRSNEVLALLREAGATPLALSVTKWGHPCHPLYLKADLQPEAYQP